MAMTLRVLGMGDAFSARYYSTCFVLECHGRRLLIDCPHPLRKMLAEATLDDPIDLDQIDGVLLTHLHGDHVSGLESVAYFFRFALGKKLPLLTHPKVYADLWEHSLKAGMQTLLTPDRRGLQTLEASDYFEPHFLDHQQSVGFGPFEIECRRTLHHIPTFALRICGEHRTWGYSADTAYDPDLIAWLAAADTVTHECNLGTHTPYEQLVDGVPIHARDKLWLCHVTDDFDGQTSAFPLHFQGQLLSI